MTTKSMTKTQVRTIVIAAAGILAVAAFGLITIPRYRHYFTKPFRPYQVLPGYVVPGYTPGYAPGYRR
jgi:hypothetical protein